MTENRIAIIREIISNPTISKAELAQIVGISTTAIDKNIAAMRDKVIRRIGPDKGGRWEVITDVITTFINLGHLTTRCPNF